MKVDVKQLNLGCKIIISLDLSDIIYYHLMIIYILNLIGMLNHFVYLIRATLTGRDQPRSILCQMFI